ncbi:MAG: helix-turn-helix domain-containing protein [Kiritimatiellae bacterium]|nr:helix-turn-helix domain-containing protein [Kiritimatiellia bacterium]
MATIGQTFKTARENRKLTTSQAAAATRIKIQHIEAMERDDFSVMAAPAYAKGFIKLYAEHLGLDPRPLVQEYLEHHAPQERQPLVAEPLSRKHAENLGKRLERITVWFRTLPREQVRKVAIALCALAVIALASWAFSRIERPAASEPVRPPPPPQTASDLEIIEPPPDPYLDDRGENAGAVE